MTRTFIALEMDEPVQRHLDGAIRQVARVLPGIRWVDPAGIHLTLAFLGELNDEQLVEAIQAAECAAAKVGPFSYRLADPGIFGSPRQPRVIWMGIEERSGSLLRLQRILNQELEQRGFEVDKRPFSPHLTLARVKNPLASDEQKKLQAFLAGKQPGVTSAYSYQVDYLNVMKSELLRAGARYTVLRACALKDG